MSEEKIMKLKAEVFDLIVAQESLVAQHQTLEKTKQEKLQELLKEDDNE